MRGPRLAFLVALLMVCGCGGRTTAPIVSSPTEHAPAPAVRVDGGAAAHDHAAPHERAAPRGETIARGDEGISDEDLESTGGPPDRADEPEEPAGAPGGEKGETGDDAVYHILRQGQTLYSVAKMYGVRLDVLLDANGIADPTRV